MSVLNNYNVIATKQIFFLQFPNVIGFALGALQMILYVVYKYCKTPPHLGEKEVEAAKLPEVTLDMLKLGTVSSPETITAVRQANKCTCGNDRRAEIEDGQNAKNGKQSSSATATWTISLTTMQCWLYPQLDIPTTTCSRYAVVFFWVNQVCEVED